VGGWDVEGLTSLPWGLVSEENFDLKRAKTILDEDHYGLQVRKEGRREGGREESLSLPTLSIAAMLPTLPILTTLPPSLPSPRTSKTASWSSWPCPSSKGARKERLFALSGRLEWERRVLGSRSLARWDESFIGSRWGVCMMWRRLRGIDARMSGRCQGRLSRYVLAWPSLFPSLPPSLPSWVLGREFNRFLSVGGLYDVAEIKGHRSTHVCGGDAWKDYSGTFLPSLPPSEV